MDSFLSLGDAPGSPCPDSTVSLFLQEALTSLLPSWVTVGLSFGCSNKAPD